MRFASARLVTVAWVFLALILAIPLRADVITTRSGARLVGWVAKITKDKVYMTTSYAGVLVILRRQIASLQTEAPMIVRLKSGRHLTGRLSASGDRILVSGSAGGAVPTTLGEIAASWPKGKPLPSGIRPDHQWTYEVSVDLNGKSGNRSQLGAAYGATATLTRPRDTLVLATNYNHQVTDQAVSADQFKAGIDYTNNYTDRNSWYARDVGGYDRIRDVSGYDTAATGAGYDFIRDVRQILTARTGVAYRYENYTDPATPDLRSVGLDLGLNYQLHLSDAQLTSRIAIVPTFESNTNLHITHETDLDLPLAASAWKLRVGVANDFSSRPADQVRRLDTTYFARLVLSWRGRDWPVRESSDPPNG